MNFSGGSPGTFTAITEAQKSACIPLTNALSPYINDTNAVWSGTTVLRYNQAYLRFKAWAPSLVFEAQVTPAGADGDTDFGIVQSNVYLSKAVCAADGVKRRVYVNGLTPGATVEIWESRQNAVNSGAGVNSGFDVPHGAGYITGIYAPSGVTFTPATCTEAICMLGMSITNYATDATPAIVYGPVGIMRLLAHAQGKELIDLTYGGGTLCGDAFTAAQRAQDVYRAYVAVGSPATFRVYIDDARNDWAYIALHGIATTGAQWATQGRAVIAAIKALIPQATFVCNTTITQTIEDNGTLLSTFRTAIAGMSDVATIIDGTALGTILGADGIHMTSAGATNYVNNGVGHALGLL